MRFSIFIFSAMLLQGCIHSLPQKKPTTAPIDAQKTLASRPDKHIKTDYCQPRRLSADQHNKLVSAQVFSSEQEREIYQASIFQQLYIRQIYNCWNVPAGTAGLKAKARVTLNDEGQISSIVIFQGNGINELEGSIKEAIKRAAPFELPEDEALRKRARNLIMDFKSQ